MIGVSTVVLVALTFASLIVGFVGGAMAGKALSDRELKKALAVEQRIKTQQLLDVLKDAKEDKC